MNGHGVSFERIRAPVSAFGPEFEARCYDGSRASIADLLQERDEVPIGIREGQWVLRQKGLTRFFIHSDTKFHRLFQRVGTRQTATRPIQARGFGERAVYASTLQASFDLYINSVEIAANKLARGETLTDTERLCAAAELSLKVQQLRSMKFTST